MDGAETPALPRDLVFVDLETTGGNAAFHRITEVGIVRMEDGQVVEEWSSLVNPECRIPSYIEGFTGITNEMVAAAPPFADIAAEVRDRLLAGASTGRPVSAGAASGSGGAPRTPLFVAHNARFDYSFLRTEFRRVGLPFSARVLCTVKLSRRLFPEFPHHSLDAVMQRHQLSCSARHRALGDARVLGDFWRKLLVDVPRERLAAATQGVLGANKLPPYLPQELADELPEGPGVYRFFDGEGVLLYIGRSVSLRARVLSHFATESGLADNGAAENGAVENAATENDAAENDAAESGVAQNRGLAGRGPGARERQPDKREQRKAQQVRRIDWVETGGIFGAQLKEAEWIKTQQPLYNRRVKPAKDNVTLRPVVNLPGIRITAIDDLAPADLAGCFGVFHSKKDARKALIDIARAQMLCLKVLGLEGSEGPAEPSAAAQLEPPAASCLAYQVGKCKGACVGKEPLVLHTVRLQMALSPLKLKLKPWPFPGRIGVREGFDETHVLDHWAYLGTARSDDELAELAATRVNAAFDVDVYRILARYLAKNPNLKWQDLRDESACT